MPEPESVSELRCDSVWRVVYATCALLMPAYALFGIVDLDGFDWRATQYAAIGALWVLDTAPEPEASLPPDFPLVRDANGNDFTACPLAPASFRRSETLILAGFALSRRHRYRVALPRSSIPDL
jgi:hypothetical protein